MINKAQSRKRVRLFAILARMAATDERNTVLGLTRVIIVTVVAAALGLSACGRKGPLEPPPGSGEAPPEAAQKPAPEPEEKKSFLLDFLIQ